jgi:hypothetical protein
VTTHNYGLPLRFGTSPCLVYDTFRFVTSIAEQSRAKSFGHAERRQALTLVEINQIVAEKISIDLKNSNFLVPNLIQSHFSSEIIKENEATYIFIPNDIKDDYFERYSELSFGRFGKWEIINSEQRKEQNIKIIIEYEPKVINIFLMCRTRMLKYCNKHSESLKYKLDIKNLQYGYIKSYLEDNEFWKN